MKTIQIILGKKSFRLFSILLFSVLPILNFSRAQGLVINEIMGSNQVTLMDQDDDYNDWIELYNGGSSMINLEGYGLSDNPNLPFKWVFPNVSIAPNSWLIVWASGKNLINTGAPLHANFSISSSGESVVLTAPDQTTVDLVEAMPFQIDVSIGRQPNGTGPWKYFYASTPGEENLGLAFDELISLPEFSHGSGLYNASFQLTISSSDPNAIVVYTLDGSEPDLNNLGGSTYTYKNVYPLAIGSAFGPLLTASYTSQVYSNPIQIIDRSPLPDQVTIKNTHQSPQYIPPSPVRKGTVVKAKTFVDGVGSPTVAKTYFVWPSGNPFDIPVVSIVIPETSLFDYHDGIYTSGEDFDIWRTNNPTNTQHYRPEWNNYWRSGIDWEYPFHLEIFEPTDFTTLLSQKAGFRIHGNTSRALAIKNLRLYARGMYDGNSEFDLPVFNTSIPFAVNPNNTVSKRILLRPDGSGGPIVYDVAFNRLMQPLFEGVTRIEHAIHFINGEYWGLTAFRDRFDSHHYANNFGLTESNVVQIDCKGNNCGLDEGFSADYNDFINLRNFVNNNDMSDQALFDQVEEQLDMRTFIDHIVLQLFSGDDSYERFFWKARVPENNNFADGRWRIATQDFEAAMSSATPNWLHWWSNEANLDLNSKWFARFQLNESFKNRFLNRYADLLNTAYLPSRFTQIIEEIYDEVNPYLAEDQHRYPRITFYMQSEKTNLLNWANQRPDSERANLLDHFNIEHSVPVTISISEENAGKVKINTVLLDGSSPGVAENPYPWNGLYFKDVPITLTATANPGFVFSHWSGSVSSTDATVEINPQDMVQVTAHFTANQLNSTTTYFWLMSNEITNDTPLSSLPSTYSINLTTANLNFQSCLDGYPFDNTHPLWRKASMERRNLPTSINYRPDANNDIAFADANMRGIQIKQPFQQDGMENTLTMDFTTVSMSEIQVSMACETDGAAEFLIFDYWNGNSWSQEGLPQHQFNIGSGYTLIEVDFTNVPEANNQINFQIRVRFGGSNLTQDTGKRVHFNNIAVDGVYGLGLASETFNPTVTLYPNPINANQEAAKFYLSSDAIINEIVIGDMMGKVLYTAKVNSKYNEVNIDFLESGVYWVQVRWGQKTEVLRLIKQ
jgi:hypothetical protein